MSTLCVFYRGFGTQKKEVLRRFLDVIPRIEESVIWTEETVQHKVLKVLHQINGSLDTWIDIYLD